MNYKITLIPGDGTGPEIAEETRRVLDATGDGKPEIIVTAGVVSKGSILAIMQANINHQS